MKVIKKPLNEGVKKEWKQFQIVSVTIYWMPSMWVRYWCSFFSSHFLFECLNVQYPLHNLLFGMPQFVATETVPDIIIFSVQTSFRTKIKSSLFLEPIAHINTVASKESFISPRLETLTRNACSTCFKEERTNENARKLLLLHSSL